MKIQIASRFGPTSKSDQESVGNYSTPGSFRPDLPWVDFQSTTRQPAPRKQTWLPPGGGFPGGGLVAL